MSDGDSNLNMIASLDVSGVLNSLKSVESASRQTERAAQEGRAPIDQKMPVASTAIRDEALSSRGLKREIQDGREAVKLTDKQIERRAKLHAILQAEAHVHERIAGADINLQDKKTRRSAGVAAMAAEESAIGRRFTGPERQRFMESWGPMWDNINRSLTGSLAELPKQFASAVRRESKDLGLDQPVSVVSPTKAADTAYKQQAVVSPEVAANRQAESDAKKQKQKNERAQQSAEKREAKKQQAQDEADEARYQREAEKTRNFLEGGDRVSRQRLRSTASDATIDRMLEEKIIQRNVTKDGHNVYSAMNEPTETDRHAVDHVNEAWRKQAGLVDAMTTSLNEVRVQLEANLRAYSTLLKGSAERLAATDPTLRAATVDGATDSRRARASIDRDVLGRLAGDRDYIDDRIGGAINNQRLQVATRQGVMSSDDYKVLKGISEVQSARDRVFTEEVRSTAPVIQADVEARTIRADRIDANWGDQEDLRRREQQQGFRASDEAARSRIEYNATDLDNQARMRSDYFLSDARIEAASIGSDTRVQADTLRDENQATQRLEKMAREVAGTLEHLQAAIYETATHIQAQRFDSDAGVNRRAEGRRQADIRRDEQHQHRVDNFDAEAEAKRQFDRDRMSSQRMSAYLGLEGAPELQQSAALERSRQRLGAAEFASTSDMVSLEAQRRRTVSDTELSILNTEDGKADAMNQAMLRARQSFIRAVAESTELFTSGLMGDVARARSQASQKLFDSDVGAEVRAEQRRQSRVRADEARAERIRDFDPQVAAQRLVEDGRMSTKAQALFMNSEAGIELRDTMAYERAKQRGRDLEFQRTPDMLAQTAANNRARTDLGMDLLDSPDQQQSVRNSVILKAREDLIRELVESKNTFVQGLREDILRAQTIASRALFDSNVGAAARQDGRERRLITLEEDRQFRRDTADARAASDVRAGLDDRRHRANVQGGILMSPDYGGKGGIRSGELMNQARQRYEDANIEMYDEGLRQTKAITESMRADIGLMAAQADSGAALAQTKGQIADTNRLSRLSGQDLDMAAETRLRQAQNQAAIMQSPAFQQAIQLEEANKQNLNNMRQMYAGGGSGGGRGGRGGGGSDGPGGIFGRYGGFKEFFMGGAMSSIRYGLPSMLLYGGLSGLGNMVNEAEELQYELKILEAQYKAVGDAASFSGARNHILDLSRDTGLAADEVARLQKQIMGAFGGDTQAEMEIDGQMLTGNALVDRQTEDAAKIAQTLHLPLAEVTDGLTAASLAFDASFDRIGSAALALEERSGVLGKETISFIGDIAPVAKEAGFSLEEFSAIAVVSQQRSGRSGTALAEAWGRVIPAITENKEALLELANVEPGLRTDDFLDAVRLGNARDILMEIGREYNNMSKEGQEGVIRMFGGRREAGAIIPALTNQDLVETYTRVAELSEGALEKRFKAVQDTLSNTLQRFSATFRQLGLEIMEMGLIDMLETSLDVLMKIMEAVSLMMGPFSMLNDITGGWFANLMLALGAMKAIQMLFRAGKVAAAGEGMFSRMAAGLGPGAPGGIREAYQRRQMLGPVGRNQGKLGAAFGAYSDTGMLPRAARGVRGGLMGLGASGRMATGLMVGGGLALTGLIAGWTAIRGTMQNQDDAQQNVIKELEKVKSEYDLTVQKNRDYAATKFDELEREWDANWWDDSVAWFRSTFGSFQSEGEKYRNQAVRLRNISGDTDTAWQEIMDTPGGVVRLREGILPRLGTKTGNVRHSLDRAVANEGGELNIGEYLSDDFYRLIESDKGRSAKFDKYIADLQGVLGLNDDDFNEIPAQVISALLVGPEKFKEELEKLLNSGNVELMPHLQTVLEALMNAADEDPVIQEILTGLENASNDAADKARTDLDRLETQRNLGVINETEYFKGVQEILKNRAAVLFGGNIMPDLDEQVAFFQLYADAAKKASDEINRKSEVLLRLNEMEFGSGSRENLSAQVFSGLVNLSNEEFTDSDSRFEAAQAIAEAQYNLSIRMAEEAGDLERVSQIQSSGIQLPPSVRAALARAKLAASNLDFASGLNDALSVISGINADVDSAIKEMNPGWKLWNFDPSAESVRDAVRKTAGGKIAGDIGMNVEKALADLFEDGMLDSGRMSDLQSTFERFAKRSQEKGLDPELKDQAQGAAEFIAALIQLAGGTYNTIYGITPSDAFDGMDIGNFMKTFKGEDQSSSGFDPNDVRRAEFEYWEAVFAEDDLRLAHIAQQRAAFEMEIANKITDPLERKAAQWRAAADQVNANRQVEDANLGRIQAKREAEASMAEFEGRQAEAMEKRITSLRELQYVAAVRGNVSEWHRLDAQIKQEVAKLSDLPVLERIGTLNLEQVEEQLAQRFVEAARKAVEAANEQMSIARGKEQIDAAKTQLMNAEAQLADAMQDARNARYELRQAELNAMGDEVGAAQVAAQQAMDNLNRLRAMGAGTTAVDQARAAYINADKAARDALFNERMDEGNFLHEMGQMTKMQYIQYLEALKGELIPGTKQFRDLELTIKRLKDDVSGDLMANLPTALGLPTLVDTRRVVQQGQAGQSYADNRVQNIQFVINGNDEARMIQVIQDTLGTDRNGVGARRY